MKQFIRNERERHFASVYFDHDNWTSQPKFFRLSNGTRYTPDFYDKEKDEYIEVVGTRSAYYQGRAKYALFQETYPELTLKILSYKGTPFKSKTRIKKILYSRLNSNSDRLDCLKCNHKWLKRVNMPRECPSCKSMAWNTKYVVNPIRDEEKKPIG